MAPSTRSTIRPSTPTRPRRPCDYDTIEKMRFYNAYDMRKPGTSARAVAREHAPSWTTAQRWL
jgi:hypothetical protein